jgi:hypothetical protein
MNQCAARRLPWVRGGCSCSDFDFGHFASGGAFASIVGAASCVCRPQGFGQLVGGERQLRVAVGEGVEPLAARELVLEEAGRLDVVDADWNDVQVAAVGDGVFVLQLARVVRLCREQNDESAGASDRLRDLSAPVGARLDHLVVPDVEVAFAQQSGEAVGNLAIASRVTNDDVVRH